LKSLITRGTAEEDKKKAHEDLETERAHSCDLSDDVDRLQKALREKEDAILQSGKLIVDLWVEKTKLAHSYKKIERASTDLVDENTTLEVKIQGEFSMPLRSLCFLRCLFSIV